ALPISVSSQYSRGGARLNQSRSRVGGGSGGGAGLSAGGEGIRQGDLRGGLCVLVVDDLGIDEEGYRHLDARAGGKRLLLEAKALDLGEIAPGQLGHHVEDGGGAQRNSRIVRRLEVGERRLADLDVDQALDRGEGPRQGRIDIGVEADADGLIENLVGGTLG